MATSPLVIVFLAAGVSYQEPAKPSTWMTVTSREGEFHVNFPAKPQEQTRAIPGAGGTIESKFVSVRAGGCLFALQRYRYPRPFPVLQITDWLNEQKRRFLQGEVKLIRENDVRVDDVAGQHLETTAPSPRANGALTTATRHFVLGSSYYVLSVTSAPNQPLPREADRFLDSFHFDKEAVKSGAMARGRPDAKGAAGAAGPTVRNATPEDALRTFMIAVVEHDEATLRAVTLPDPDLDWLLRGEPAPARSVERIRALTKETKIRRLKPGDRIKRPEGGVAVIGREEVNADRALLIPEGASEPIRLERIEGRWKLDARPAIDHAKEAATAIQRGRKP